MNDADHRDDLQLGAEPRKHARAAADGSSLASMGRAGRPNSRQPSKSLELLSVVSRESRLQFEP